MDTFNLLPQYKACSYCKSLTVDVKLINEDYFFICHLCNRITKWSQSTVLEKSKIPLTTIEKLLVLYLDNKTANEANTILGYHFINEGLNQKTVYRYFCIFNTIVHDYVYNKMQSKVLDGDVEFDETYLFKEKKSSAPHRPYSNNTQWLFGIRKRDTSELIYCSTSSKKR